MPPRSRLPEPVCRQHQACALVLRWGNPPWSFGDPLPTCQFSIRSVLWCGSYAALLSRMLKNPDPPSHSQFRSPQQLANPFSLYVLVVVVCWAWRSFSATASSRPLNAVSVGAHLAGASVIFLMFELSQPNSGVIRLSPASSTGSCRFWMRRRRGRRGRCEETMGAS